MGAAEAERTRAARGEPPYSKTKGDISPGYAAKVYSESRRSQQAVRSNIEEINKQRSQIQSQLKTHQANVARLQAERDKIQAMPLINPTGTDPARALTQQIEAEQRAIQNESRQLDYLSKARTELGKREQTIQKDVTQAALSVGAARTTKGPVDTGAFSSSRTMAQDRPEPIAPQRTRAKATTGVKEKLYANPLFMQDASSYTRPELFTDVTRQERPKAQTGVTDKLFINPAYVTKQEQREIDQTRTAWTISLDETPQPRSQAFAISLSEGAPKQPDTITQAEFDAMTPQQQAVYNAEVAAWNKYVAVKKQEDILQWKQAKSQLLIDIGNLKSKGVKTLSALTTQGPKDIPINNAFKALSSGKIGGATILGVMPISNVPEGYTVAGSLSAPVFIPEQQKVFGPQPTPFFKEQKKIEAFTGADLGFASPITKGIDVAFETDKPAERRSEINQRLTGFAAPFVNIGSIIYDTGKAVAKEIRKPGAGFEFRGTNIATGGNPLNLPWPRAQTPPQETALGTILEGKIPDIQKPYTQGTILGDISLVASGFFRLKGGKAKQPKTEIGKVPEQMRKPPGEPASNLNDLYREPLRLEKTPRQKMLEQAREQTVAEKVITKRMQEIAEAGPEKAVIRYNPKRQQIDRELINIRLGKTEGFLTKGKPEPKYSVSGEAPISTQLKEAKAATIKENIKRSELEDVLSTGAMERMMPEKPKFKVTTEREFRELKQAKEPVTKTPVELGRGYPDLLRLKEGSLFNVPKQGPKTFFEKLSELRRNPQLEEREPFKFYIKKELGFPESEPIDLTGRVKLEPTLLIKKEEAELFKSEAPIFKLFTEKELKQAKSDIIKENIKRSELEDVLSTGAMERMMPEKPKFKVTTEREIKELKAAKKETTQPRLLLKEEAKVEVLQKVNLKKEITDQLFSRAGFTSTKISLGKGKPVLVAGGSATTALPAPFIGKVAADTSGITNQTQGNVTTPIIPTQSEPATLVQPVQTKPSLQTVAVISLGSSPVVSRGRINIPRRTTSAQSAIISRQERASKRKSVPIFAPVRKQMPERKTGVIPLTRPRQTPLLTPGLTPNLIPTLKQPPIWPPDRPPRWPPRPPPNPFAFRTKRGKKRRAKEEEMDKIGFLGFTNITEIMGVRTTKSDITYGDIKTARLAAKNIKLGARGQFSASKKRSMLSQPTRFFTPTKKQSSSFNRLKL